jgi:hypothetical protein
MIYAQRDNAVSHIHRAQISVMSTGKIAAGDQHIGIAMQIAAIITLTPISVYILHVCDCSWHHDVRTKFPSRVVNTPLPKVTLDSNYSEGLCSCGMTSNLLE